MQTKLLITLGFTYREWRQWSCSDCLNDHCAAFRYASGLPLKPLAPLITYIVWHIIYNCDQHPPQAARSGSDVIANSGVVTRNSVGQSLDDARLWVWCRLRFQTASGIAALVSRSAECVADPPKPFAYAIRSIAGRCVSYVGLLSLQPPVGFATRIELMNAQQIY